MNKLSNNLIPPLFNLKIIIFLAQDEPTNWIPPLLHLNPDDCKNELLRLNLTRNKNTDRKIVNFQVFADSVHQAELERYQVEVNRQIIHPRRNRNFQTPGVHFNIPQSPTPTTSEISNSALPETPTLLSQHSTSSLPSDYLGSTPTSEQIRENPFNPPQSHRTATILDSTLIYTR